MNDQTSSPDIAVFPGTFDPVTLGHLDIIRRACRLYKDVIVAIGENPLKSAVFTPEERKQMLAAHTGDLPNCRIMTYGGLTVEFAAAVQAGVMIRGIRDTVDLNAEMELATVNRIIGDVETVFLLTSGQHVLTSSTLIKQIVEIGRYDEERLAKLVPLDVARKLEERLRGRR